jgi:chromosome segregation ATPase
MARSTITQEDVFSAAREIVERGEKPTVLEVHKILGKGSYSTITKHLRIWEDSSEAIDARIELLPQEIEVPEFLLNDTLILTKKTWTAARAMADNLLANERNALEEAKLNYLEEIEQAINLADQATSEQERLEELLTNSNEANITLEAKAKEITIKLQNREDILLESQQTIKRLQDEVDNLRADNEALNKKSTEIEASLVSEKRHTQHLEKEFKELRQEHKQSLQKAEDRNNTEIKRLSEANEKSISIIIQQHDNEIKSALNHVNELKSINDKSTQKIQVQAGLIGELKVKSETSSKALINAESLIKTLKNE